MFKTILLYLLFVNFVALHAQTSDSKGALNIKADPRIRALMTHQKYWADSVGTEPGFRVQIFSSSGVSSKTQALEEKAKCTAIFPEQKAYLVSQMPYFKVRVGNFRTRLDALKFHAEVKSVYPNAFVVPDEISTK